MRSLDFPLRRLIAVNSDSQRVPLNLFICSKRVMARLDKAIEEVLLEYSNKEKRSKLRKRKK